MPVLSLENLPNRFMLKRVLTHQSIDVQIMEDATVYSTLSVGSVTHRVPVNVFVGGNTGERILPFQGFIFGDGISEIPGS
jgi:hypothetical protein